VETGPVKRVRPVRFATLIASLAAVCVMLAVLLAIVMGATDDSDPKVKPALARLAWGILATLVLTSLLLVWVLTRYIAFRLRPSEDKAPTEYVDAWSLAGKRFQLRESDLPEDQEDSDQSGAGPGKV
jgi:hypothetical protein